MLAAPRSKNRKRVMRGMLFFWLLRMAMGKGLELVSSLEHSRGVKGVIGIQTSKRNGQAVGACLVSEKDEIMLITNNGVIVVLEYQSKRDGQVDTRSAFN